MRMVCCQFLLPVLFMVAASGLSEGSPLERQNVKREAPSPRVVEIPTPLHYDHQEHQSSRVPSTFTRDLGVQSVSLFSSELSSSSQPRIKEMSKTSESTKKRAQGVRRKGSKRGKVSNKDLLHHLGMVKLKTPAINHHRKRLASQSRKTHGLKSGGDSKMFVIKLPPNPYYYAHHDLPTPKFEGVNSLSGDFNMNGKPSRVYHWNIPMLKKMVARKAGSTGKSAVFADSEVFNIDKQATWNDTGDDKSVYRKASFYAPKKQSKHPFRKYFAGNGKPHSFYVIDKSSHKKPASVHRLLP